MATTPTKPKTHDDQGQNGGLITPNQPIGGGNQITPPTVRVDRLPVIPEENYDMEYREMEQEEQEEEMEEQEEEEQEEDEEMEQKTKRKRAPQSAALKAYNKKKREFAKIFPILDDAMKSDTLAHHDSLDGGFYAKDMYQIIEDSIIMIKGYYNKYENISLVDIGCSHGLVLLVAALFDEISVVIGIELSPNVLHNYATFLRNVWKAMTIDIELRDACFEKWRSKIRIAQGNAFDFGTHAYAHIDIIYSFSPANTIFEFGIRSILTMFTNVKCVIYSPNPGADRKTLGNIMSGRAAQYEKDKQFALVYFDGSSFFDEKDNNYSRELVISCSLIADQNDIDQTVKFRYDKDEKCYLKGYDKKMNTLDTELSTTDNKASIFMFPIRDATNEPYLINAENIISYVQYEVADPSEFEHMCTSGSVIPTLKSKWDHIIRAPVNVHPIMSLILDLLNENKLFRITYDIWIDGVDLELVIAQSVKYKGMTYGKGAIFHLDNVVFPKTEFNDQPICPSIKNQLLWDSMQSAQIEYYELEQRVDQEGKYIEYPKKDNMTWCRYYADENNIASTIKNEEMIHFDYNATHDFFIAMPAKHHKNSGPAVIPTPKQKVVLTENTRISDEESMTKDDIWNKDVLVDFFPERELVFAQLQAMDKKHPFNWCL